MDVMALAKKIRNMAFMTLVKMILNIYAKKFQGATNMIDAMTETVLLHLK